MAAFFRLVTRNCSERLIDITVTAINCALALLAMIIVTSVASDAMANTCQPTSREHQMRQGITHQFHPGPIQDHVLRGSVYRNKTTSSYVMCGVLCMQENTCKSFNYCNDKRCELNSAMYNENNTALEPSSGCVYFDEQIHEVSTSSGTGTSPCQTYTTEPNKKLYLPEPLTSPMRFEFTVHSSADYVKLYLSPNQSGYDHAVYSVRLAATESYFHKRTAPSIWSWVQYKSGYNYIGVPIIITYDDNDHIEVQVTGMEETLMTYDFIPPIPASSWFITLYSGYNVAEWSFYKPCIHVSKK